MKTIIWHLSKFHIVYRWKPRLPQSQWPIGQIPVRMDGAADLTPCSLSPGPSLPFLQWCFMEWPCLQCHTTGNQHVIWYPSTNISHLIWAHVVPWPSCLVHQICVLMAESSECGFEFWLWPWLLCPWARHFIYTCFSSTRSENGYLSMSG